MLKKDQVEELENLTFDKAKRALSNNRLSTAHTLVDILLGLKQLQTEVGSDSTHAIGFVHHVDEEVEDWEGKK